jgi:hypothetical protein
VVAIQVASLGDDQLSFGKTFPPNWVMASLISSSRSGKDGAGIYIERNSVKYSN